MFCTLSKLYDVPVRFVPPPLFWGCVLLFLRSSKGSCRSISDDLSCSCKLNYSCTMTQTITAFRHNYSRLFCYVVCFLYPTHVKQERFSRKLLYGFNKAGHSCTLLLDTSYFSLFKRKVIKQRYLNCVESHLSFSWACILWELKAFERYTCYSVYRLCLLVPLYF